MLRTGPAALSLPGPFGAAGFHPTVATSTAGLLRPFRSRRPWRAVSCAFRTPAVRLPGCKEQRRFACRVPRAASRRCGGSLLSSTSGAFSPFKPLSPGLRQAQTLSAVQGKWHAVNRAQDSCHRPFSFTPLRRTALKRVKVTTSGRVQQVPAKRQNRGPGNSTGDGF